MKPLWMSVVLIVTCGLSAAQAQSKVLYDPRVPGPKVQVSAAERQLIRSAAQQAMKAGAWQVDFDLSTCPGEDFTVHGAAPGAFTQANTTETAYLYSQCLYRPGNLQGLLIVRNGKPVAHHVFVGQSYELHAARDVNRNGRSELLLTGGFTGGGTSEDGVDLVEYLNGAPRVLHAFNTHYDNCTGQQTTSTSYVLKVVPGPRLTFTADTYSGSCTGRAALKSKDRPAPVNPYGGKVTYIRAPLPTVTPAAPPPQASGDVALNAFLNLMGSDILSKRDPACEGMPSMPDNGQVIARIEAAMLKMGYMRNTNVPLAFIAIRGGGFFFYPDRRLSKICLKRL